MIFLIGTGPMAIDYAKVLKKIGQDFTVIGRSKSGIEKFETTIGIHAFAGGVVKYIEQYGTECLKDNHVIIATGTEALMSILKIVLMHNPKRVLVEKPAAISINELLESESILKDYFNKVYIAYNRRFYASTRKVVELIAEDGGLENMHFEFTEWAHKIEPLDKPNEVKQNWFFANSTHVVDLAFFIAGMPIKWNQYNGNGGLSWHPISKFSGAGITSNNVLFSYNSNWESAGRWSIELMTKTNRYYLRPMEELWVQKKGSVNVEKVEIDYDLDHQFKPGLFLQVEEFLKDENIGASLLKLDNHFVNTKFIYQKMLS